jgi:hypothetical protein
LAGQSGCRCEKEKKSWVSDFTWLSRDCHACPRDDRCKLHRRKTVSRSSFEYASSSSQTSHQSLRNVARTRFRDSTRRVQKNHFGRRRLGILSRGLVNGTHHATEEETTSGISSILLEHAQREISRPSRSSPVQQTEAHRAFTHDLPSSTRSSTSGSNVARPHLRFKRTLDYGSRESPWPLPSN